MDAGPTLKANAKTTKVVEPRVSTLDHPAEFAQSAAVFSAAPGNHRFDAALAKPLTMLVGVVASICVDDFGFLKRSAARAEWVGWRQRSRHRTRHVRHACVTADNGTRGRIRLVRQTHGRTGLRIDEHLVPAAREFPSARGREAHTVFLAFDFPGYAGLHVATQWMRGLDFRSCVAGGNDLDQTSMRP